MLSLSLSALRLLLAFEPGCSSMRRSIQHARLIVLHVRKSRDFYLDFLDLISVGLAALAN